MNPVSEPSAAVRPRTYGVTGGIGSGKSYVCRMLAAAGIPVFYCDDEAKRIIRTDAAVRASLTRVVGEGLYDSAGQLVKPVLAAYLCRGAGSAARVNAVVWPRVAEAWQAWCARQTAPVAVMECALLFESGFDRLTDRTVCVTAPDEVRLGRVMRRDGVSRETALGWMALQLPEAEKCRRADHVVRNDGCADLAAQIRDIWAVGTLDAR